MLLKNEASTVKMRPGYVWRMFLLSEVAQLGQLIQQLLQVSIGDLILKTRNERLGLLGIIATQTTCSEEDASQ